MPEESSEPRFQFNAAAVHARSSDDLRFALALAEQRLEAAEQARREAEQARLDLTAELAQATAAKVALFKEKAALVNENELLLKRITDLVTQLSTATKRDLQLALSAEISTLQRRLDERNRSLYGTSSERRPRPEDESAAKPPRRKKSSGGTRTRQPQLPIVEVRHELSPAQMAHGCKPCQGGLVPMNGQSERSEMASVCPVRYVIEVHDCQKYRCVECGWITTAPGPDKLIAGGRYSPEFAVDVAVDKYQDALPLERQVKRMARAGLTVTRQALWDQLERMYILLLPTLLAIHNHVLKAPVCHADETPWRMMDNKGGTKRWWLWTLSDGVAVYYQLVSGRGAADARQLLHDYAGVLMTDDYAVYSALAGERTRKGGVQRVIDQDGKFVDIWTPDFTLATCWMHVRRYFMLAERYHPEVAPALDLIGELYAVEDEARQIAERCRLAQGGAPLPAGAVDSHLLDARRRLRDERSKGCIEKLAAWRKGAISLDGTAMAEAIAHLDRTWSRLVLFLDDARIPLDNGHAERQIRGPVVGRNNYQGSRSEAGARAAALFFSLLGSARALGLDPRAYLLAAVRLAMKTPGAALTPWDYAASLVVAPDPQPG